MIKKFLLLTSFIYVCIITLFVCGIWAEEDDDITRPGEMPCKAAVSMLTKRQMAGIGNCTKLMKFKNAKDKSAKMNCILRCVAVNVQLLNAEGTLDRRTTDRFIKREIPPNLLEKASAIINTCYDQSHGKLDPNEEFCQSYSPLVKCLLDGIPKFCASK